MLVKSVCIHSDSLFPVTVKMNTMSVVFQAVSPNRAFRYIGFSTCICSGQPMICQWSGEILTEMYIKLSKRKNY